MIVPFLWMLSTSLKTTAQSMAFPPEWWPRPFIWENYTQIYEYMPFFTFLFNSVKITFFVLVGQLLTCSLAGYAFAKLRFPGRRPLFLILLSTMMIPSQVTLIPVFIIMKSLGWINTHYALIVPAFFGSVFGTFLLRQFFLGLPNDLEDAARIDGCSPFGIYWRIMLPLAKPSLATLGIFTFMGTWNDFMRPLIYLSDMDKMTLPVGLALLSNHQDIRIPLIMAGAVLSLLPILVLYIFGQKYFVQGIALTGMKG
ncbi:MAG: carbohydrate ABC transporter permease [Gemmatimonadetes bacterium]|nr:carbohydrate ABC transporter permease [Gemmatimonadota bacterium]